MNAYIISLMVAAVAVAVVELLLPRGEGGRVSATVRMVAGLFLLVALITPLRAGIDLVQDAMNGELADRVIDQLSPDTLSADPLEVWNATLSAMGRSEVEIFVQNALFNRFSIPSTDCTVEAICGAEADTLTLVEVRIALHGPSVLHNPHPIEAYITETLACPCYVTMGKP